MAKIAKLVSFSIAWCKKTCQKWLWESHSFKVRQVAFMKPVQCIIFAWITVI